MGSKNQLTGWPDPWAPINKATAGALIGVSKDTIERIAGAIARGEPIPKVRNPKAIEIGRIFADEDAGTTTSTVSALHVYRVLTIDPKTLDGPFIKAKEKPQNGNRRKRSVVSDQTVLGGMSDTDLRAQLNSVVARARAAVGGRVPWAELKALADALSARGLPPGGVVHGQPIARIDLKKCETWGFVGVFLAQAEPADLWPFVLPARSRRPVDLFSASSDDIKYGQLIGLTVEEWLALMAAALANERRQERSESEAEFLKAAVQPVAGNASNSNEAS